MPVPDASPLIRLHASDNVLVVRGDCTDEEIVDALTKVGLGGWLAGLPDGLNTILTGGSHAVSAGQRRRLLLARALVSPARIVLLDEPTEHLDAANPRTLGERADRGPQVEQMAVAPRDESCCGAVAERVAHVLAHFVAASTRGGTDHRFDVARLDTRVARQSRQRRFDHAGRGTAPSRMNGGDGTTAAIPKQYRRAIGRHDADGHSRRRRHHRIACSVVLCGIVVPDRPGCRLCRY